MVFDFIYRTFLVGLQHVLAFPLLYLCVLKIEALFVVRIFYNIRCFFGSQLDRVWMAALYNRARHSFSSSLFVKVVFRFYTYRVWRRTFSFLYFETRVANAGQWAKAIFCSVVSSFFSFWVKLVSNVIFVYPPSTLKHIVIGGGMSKLALLTSSQSSAMIIT
jgi:hypothetical protein